MNRYRVAKAMGNDAYEEAVEEDRELLAAFGLRLLGVESGVRAAVEKELRGDRIHPWNVITIENKTWEWLRPILVAMRDQGRTEGRILAQAVVSFGN